MQGLKKEKNPLVLCSLIRNFAHWQITDVNEIKVRKWLSNKQRHPELRVHREGGPVSFNVKFIEKR